jgi:hypothetical protein
MFHVISAGSAETLYIHLMVIKHYRIDICVVLALSFVLLCVMKRDEKACSKKERERVCVCVYVYLYVCA